MYLPGLPSSIFAYRKQSRQHTIKIILCPAVHTPSGEHLEVWFLVTNTFFLRWVIKSQSASRTSSTCKMTSLILFWGWQFLCGKKNSVDQRCSFKDWATGNLLTNKLMWFVWAVSLAVLGLQLKWDSLPLLSQMTDAWWLGNVADCLKVRLHNNSSSKQRTGLITAFLKQ